MGPVKDMSVLVVEDEARMRELLERAIGSWGHEVRSARTGEDAIRLLEDKPSAIVLLDLNLPGMGGMECFEVVRRRWPETQVVVLTGFGDLESAKRAIHLDVVEFLTKPCHLGDMEVALDRARKRLEERTKLPETQAAEGDPAPEAGETATLEQYERQHIIEALKRHGGNRSETAAELGISLRTLYYRLAEYQRQGYEVE